MFLLVSLWLETCALSWSDWGLMIYEIRIQLHKQEYIYRELSAVSCISRLPRSRRNVRWDGFGEGKFEDEYELVMENGRTSTGL